MVSCGTLQKIYTKLNLSPLNLIYWNLYHEDNIQENTHQLKDLQKDIRVLKIFDSLNVLYHP